MNLGTKQRIVNVTDDILLYASDGTAATTVATIDRVSIAGTGTFSVSTLADLIASRAIDPTLEVATLTFTGTTTEKTDLGFTLEVGTYRNKSRYERYNWMNGAALVFGVTVASGKTGAEVAALVKSVIDQRISRYNDLPFTTAISTSGVITLTAISGDFTFSSAALTSNLEEISVTLAVTTAGSEGSGLGYQLEESVSMLTEQNAYAGAIKADERVILADKYASFYFNSAFTTGVMPEPSPAGLKNYSGSSAFALYINEKLASDEKVLLLTELFINLGGDVTAADGATVAGDDDAAKTTDFWS